MKRTLIALCLGCIVLSSCSENNDGDLNTKKELIGIHLLKHDRTLPVTIIPRYWTKDDQGKVIKFGEYEYPPIGSVEYSDNQITITEPLLYLEEGTSSVYKKIVYLENNRIKKIDSSYTHKREGHDDFGSSETFHYFYDDEGYLIQVLNERNGYHKEFVNITIENGNVVKLVNEEVTYRYSYDTKEYIPMSDWALCTPIQLSTPGFIFMLLDDIMGKKNKNNITRVDIEYKPDHVFSYDFIEMTYEPEFDAHNNILAINHTGVLTNHSADGGIANAFSDVKTEFIYRDVEK